MFKYMKMLQYPINIKTTDAKLAMAIMSQLGGPDGEAGAATRYLSQRYAMPNDKVAGLMTDIGTEELGHEEMIATIVKSLTKNLSMDEIEKSGFTPYYIDHTIGIYPQSAAGVPFSTATLQSTGDPITDLYEDMAAEQKARLTYDNILRLCRDNPDVTNAIRFLREREMVHFQRFGEALQIIHDQADSKNVYACNMAFDKRKC